MDKHFVKHAPGAKTRICITGACGFVGHHIVEHLLKNTDWEIVVLDCLTYAGNLNRLTDIDIWEKEKHRVKFVWHDLKSPITELTHSMLGQVDYVWHFAAETHVDTSLINSIPFAQANVVGTTNLLEYLKHYQKPKKIVYFSTDEVFGPAPYPSSTDIPIRYSENDSLNPSNPYSASKAGGEMMARSFANSFGLPIMITRTMNVYGERQHPEKFLPKVIISIVEGKKVLLHGYQGSPSLRCWVHAREAADILLFLMEKGVVMDKAHQADRGYGVYHVIGEEWNVVDMANKISNIIKGRDLKDEEIEYIDIFKDRPGHDKRYSLDGQKVIKLGYIPPKQYPNLGIVLEKMTKWMTSKEHKHWLNL